MLPLLFAAAGINAVVGFVAFETTRSEVREVAATRAGALAAAIAKTVDRSALVPQLVGQDAQVLALLHTTPLASDAQTVSRRLAQTAAETGTEVLYVLDRNGMTLASSNWDQPQSFVGRNFSFRPYFQNAAAGRPDHYMALGTTSMRLGYYLSHPVNIDGQFSGAVVAKLGVDMLERNWGVAPDIMLVVDEAGVVLLTNRPTWRFRTIHPLTEAQRVAIRVSQRYPSQELTQLPIQFSKDTATLNGGEDVGDYLVSSIPLPQSHSQIYVLATAEPVWAHTVNAMVLSVGLLTLIAASYIFLEKRRESVRRHVEREARMRDILEQRVDERTADLQLANRRLRDAQGDLIQAAKLAALGQMSASLAHELNQPVAAIRGFAENGLILIERGRLPEASTNLREVVAMSERIGVITRHLKAFARRAPPDIGQVPLRPAVFHCLALMAGRMKELSVNVTVDVADGLIVTAEEVRIEQVIVNLLQNACDAVSDAERREILIDADSSGAWIEMRVRDSGPGIALEILPRLFDSFFTTKSAGLGLGLSISRDIIREFGGRIEAMNGTNGGSLFVIRLPAAA